MKRVRVVLAALAATAVFGAAGPAHASAGGESAVGKQALDLMCSLKGGAVYFSPYAITRCDAAYARFGFEVERRLCQGWLNGEFVSAPSVGRPNRAGWACVPGSPS